MNRSKLQLVECDLIFRSGVARLSGMEWKSLYYAAVVYKQLLMELIEIMIYVNRVLLVKCAVVFVLILDCQFNACADGRYILHEHKRRYDSTTNNTLTVILSPSAFCWSWNHNLFLDKNDMWLLDGWHETLWNMNFTMSIFSFKLAAVNHMNKDFHIPQLLAANDFAIK